MVHYGPLTAVGYVECMIEIAEQAAARGIKPTHLYVASGGGTQAGLELGNRALGLGLAIRGFTPVWTEDGRTGHQAELANLTAELLGLDVSVRPEEIYNSSDMLGPGYAEVTPEGLEAIRLVARTEGIFLEPVYTAKAFAGLVRDIRGGRLTAEHTVVFVHTGGGPLVFTYAAELARRA